MRQRKAEGGDAGSLIWAEASTLLTRGPHGPHAAIGCGPHVVDLVGQAQDSPRGLIVSIDLSSRKTIGSAKEREGLYYFDEIYLLGQCPPTVCNSASYPKDSELLLWHKRMGHPSFQQIGNTCHSRRPKSKFNETLISEALKKSEPVIVPTPWEYGSNSNQVTNDLPIALRKQPRSCTLHPISKFVSYNALSAKCRAFTTNLDRIQIHKNIQEVLEIPEWKEVVMEEIRALEKNDWEVMNLPRKKPVGCKWVFTVKYKADDIVERYKAHLVAKGFTQTYDIDYTETFAPVAKLNIIQVLLFLVANLDWPLHQFDIKNVFLNGNWKKKCL
ncbi:Retrovirus-related Pol polyprotein from transposon TNT 1-94 [Vitis vinifera]|uniref:Retrovirus-related Pol polyprotein from transposon TNT 1-94 n=1 Tax=Vitis vinifera TaxID=29760 RepID=A0A438JHI5_VITVI|nr:Retrovirus-related Pol polyprotein from transposon TNT 1-94 [Vitis vinifera]